MYNLHILTLYSTRIIHMQTMHNMRTWRNIAYGEI